jgi:hypothetical protein
MKTSDLSIKELAAFIGVSTDTIRRAYRRVRFRHGQDRSTGLIYAKSCVWPRRNAEAEFGARSASAPGGGAGCAQADRSRLVTRGLG